MEFDENGTRNGSDTQLFKYRRNESYIGKMIMCATVRCYISYPDPVRTGEMLTF